MSRLWDTPDFWARSEANEALREIPDIAPAALADAFEKSAASYDGDPEIVTLIAADLRRRAAAGVRFWPGPQATAQRPDDRRAATGSPGLVDIAELIDDEIPW